MAELVNHLAAAIFGVLVAVPVLIASQWIPRFNYDVVGGRAFPVALAVLLLGLSAAKAVLAWRAWRSGREAGRAPAAPVWSPERPARVVLAATAAYALLLFVRVDFIWLSGGYMLAAGALSRPDRRGFVEALGMAGFVVLALLGMEAFLSLRLIGR
ncbi:MAG: hypothetical protein R3D25_20330 [Geminicoccaceae bacterium]